MSEHPHTGHNREEQGALFDVSFEGNGAVEPSQHRLTAHFEDNPTGDGTFESPTLPEVPVIEGDPALLETARADAERRKHSAAQRGLHSPLQRDGSYQNIRLGDWLPGYGAVTERDWDNAVVKARELESARVARELAQPALLGASSGRVEEAVAQTADALDIRRGLFPVETNSNIDYAEAGTQIKLEALRDDGRAGFLPKSHREKSQAYELLDYMTPGKYERGVSTRLDEIFYHQQKNADKAGKTPVEGYDIANDTVRSVVREWGDYYTNARSSWRKLHALQKLIHDTPNQRFSMADLLDDEANGEVATQLIRYDSLRKRRDTKEPIGFDPLWVREDRSNPTDDKHKTVEDVFSHQNEEFMAAFVRRRAEQMTVGEARRLVLEAKRDEALRAKFWRGNLEDLHDDYQPYAKLALEQGKAA